MRQYRSLLAVCLAGCLLLGAVSGVTVASDHSYDLTVSDAVETPSKTVSYDGNSYEIDAFAVREPGETLQMDVTVADGEDFDIDLYNSDEQVEMFVSGEGDQTVSFDGDQTSDLSPGTYSLNLRVDSLTRTIHPVVISGYDISTTLPDEANSSETIEIESTVTPTELDDDPADVEIVFWNEDHVERIDADGEDGSYSATIDLDDVSTGEYNVHVAALGEEEFQGEQEILGLSEQRTIEVTAEDGDSDSDEDDTTDGGGNPEGGGTAPVDGGGAPADGTEDTDGDNITDGNESETSPEQSSGETTVETARLVDENADSPGLQVSFKNTTTRAVTFDTGNETAEETSGNVTVADHSDPPSETTAPTGSLRIVEITVPEGVREMAATIEFVVSTDTVADASDLRVERYDSDSGTWSQLETDVVEMSETTVTISAETPGFSFFAITETTDDTDTPTSSPTSTSTPGENDSGVLTPSSPSEEDQPPSTPTEQPEDQLGFGIIPAISAIFLAMGGNVVRIRLNSDGVDS